jgi:hypothetical protein
VILASADGVPDYLGFDAGKPRVYDWVGQARDRQERWHTPIFGSVSI